MHVFSAFNPAAISVSHRSSCISVCSHRETFVSFSPYILKRKLYTNSGKNPKLPAHFLF